MSICSLLLTFWNRSQRALIIAALVALSTAAVSAQDSTAAAAPAAASGGANGVPTDDAAIAAGKTLFNANCKSCHALDKKLVGPALAGVTERRDIGWLKKWIHNAPEMIKSGDPIAKQLFDEYKSVMTAFPSFKDEEILQMLAYIQKGEAAAAPVATDGATANAEAGTAPASNDSTLVIILTVLLIILILIVIVLLLISTLVVKQLKSREDLDEDDRELVEQKHDVLKAITHPAFIGALVIITGLVGFKLAVTKGLYGIGVQQGYAPTQPINFSHKIHAGDHEIDCKYCHSTVTKSKQAGIPSANICMNCHSEIKTDSKEIQKIHRAIDYDVNSKTYGTNTKPIQWVRVHNLPDLAYFNHSQHVVAGGIECETCHGPIKEMPVVYQYSPLTMGWCIDCHRETVVKAEGNAYYDKLMEAHKKNTGKKEMTVEDIGGLECSKCHY